ncbi:MAG TPA: exopolysaccharide biosynthesis polyprenyl glycosylphosphotransferase [Solirubrobacterales bacterium]|nr:exopolysaccharide biosynthesis polyprenyl glycosylphosphotransferase [Solirubrobacterales bacterium]
MDRVLLPSLGALLVGGLSESYELLVVAFLAFLAASAIVRPNLPWLHLVRFAKLPLEAVPPAAALALIVMAAGLSGLPHLSVADIAITLSAMTLLGVLTSMLIDSVNPVSAPSRIAVIGSALSAGELARELRLAAVSRYTVVGRITYQEDHEGEEEDRLGEDREVPLLGSLEDLANVVERERVDLLVMSSEVPRFRVFEEVANRCLHLPVRLMELTGFYEDVFGHVPVAEINAAWFQYIMHPRYSPITPHAKRALDLAVGLTLGAIFLPILLICGLIIRRDGGPALFKQTRIGEGGRPLVVHKLRTMKVDAGLDSQWASPGDPRITRFGATLRKLHLDELPQIVNVLRGEMSIVGPRPEQPEFVERLEGLLPFYSRRHLIKPGITGWAQVRCGYAGSDEGSAWKLCHDLYYLKYRSTAFDLSILAETLSSVFGNKAHAVNTSTARLVQSDPVAVVGDPLGRSTVNS